MRYMAIVKATEDTEAGHLPDEATLAAMGRFNEDLAAAGVILDMDGLHPTSEGARVRFGAGGSRTVIDGPFAETKELVGGYWIWRAESLAEAVAWAERCPPVWKDGGEIELRLMGCNGPHDPALECRGRAGDSREASNERGETMRFMVIIKATADSENGVMPDEKLLKAMGDFNEELVKAGVMLAGEGLQPSSKGARVKIASDGSRTVVDGPFAETKELIAGFWLWQAKSMEECLEWVKRCPDPFEGECEIEVRRVFEAEDFGEAFTPELREQEDRIRAEVSKRNP